MKRGSSSSQPGQPNRARRGRERGWEGVCETPLGSCAAGDRARAGNEWLENSRDSPWPEEGGGGCVCVAGICPHAGFPPSPGGDSPNPAGQSRWARERGRDAPTLPSRLGTLGGAAWGRLSARGREGLRLLLIYFSSLRLQARGSWMLRRGLKIPPRSPGLRE